MDPFERSTVDRLLSTTRAVRRRLDLERSVDEADLRDCIRLATYAPNASNAQRWRWLVVRDPARKRDVARHYQAGLREPMLALLAERRAQGDEAGVRHSETILRLADDLARVPALVIPCFQGEVVNGQRYVATATLFASLLPAVWSFQLALRSRGLGSTLTTIHLFFEKEVAELLKMPEDVMQVALLPVAYTKGTDFKIAKRQPPEEITSFKRGGLFY